MESRKPLEIQDLVLEVTRRCNMACPHCMRGDAQDRSMSMHTIESILSRVSRILTLTFTGGEPSLRADILLKTLELAKKYSVEVDQVYLVTNGKEVTDLFLETCRRWQTYTVMQYLTAGERISDSKIRTALHWINDEERTYGCYVALSADQYHEPIPAENVAVLSTLPHLVADKTEGYASAQHQDEYIIKTGRAKDNDIGQTPAEQMRPLDYRMDSARRIYYRESEDKYETDALFVSATGSILKNCDYSYEDQERFRVGKIQHGLKPDAEWLDRVIRDHGQLE